MSRYFADASVLLEIMLKREQYAACVQALSDDRYSYSTSSLTAHLLYHFGQKEKVKPVIVAEIVGLCQILAVDKATVRLAQERYDGKDFEDCLQAACAEAGGCDQILTLDKRFARDSGTSLPVRVIS